MFDEFRVTDLILQKCSIFNSSPSLIHLLNDFSTVVNAKGFH